MTTPRLQPSLKARLERLGPVRAIPRVADGAPVVMSLRLAVTHDLKPVTATTTLAKCGLSLLEAKRTVERLIDDGLAVVELPKVEDRKTVQEELAEAGVACSPL